MLLTASKTIISLLHLLSILSYALSQAFVDEKMVLACAASNNTASNTFISNLNSLFNQKLHSEAGKSLYSNATEGEFPYTVYGLYLCKFNISFQSCQRCIVAAVNAVLQKCDGTKDAIIWYQVQECLVRFSDHSLPVTDTSLPLCMQGVQNSSVPVPDNFTKSLIQSFNDVVAMPSLSSFSNATKETKISSIITLQSFGQCIPAMSKEDCRICLNETINLIPKCFVPRGTGFGRVLFPSCFMGFELYQFSKVPAVGAQGPISSSRGKRRGAALIAIGTTLSVVIVALFGSFLWYRWRRYKRDQEEKTNSREVQILHWEGRIGNDHSYDILRGMPMKSQEFPLFPLGLVLEATKHFSVENKLGEGGFGPVYKGTLADGKDVAVKRLSRTSGQGLREFKNEVCLIAKLQHKNLVRLLGCCLEGQELLLIYEYMPNKSLDFLLFDSTMSGQLNWEKRMGIINGIARGILYLHEDSRLRIIHRDLKASNVLLDHEMNPKISDFGMARLFVGNQNEANTNRVVGTYGYMAPEYAMEGLFSIKSDVFSFGVLLLEIISGRKNTKFYLSEHGQSLLNYTWKLWCEGHAVELMDPVLKQSCITDEVLKCIHIGLLCVQEDPADRPTMSSVVVMLASDSMILPQPTQPAFSIGRVVKYGQFLPYTKECSVNEVTFSNVLPR